MGKLNAEAGSENIMVGLVIGRHCLSDRNNDVEWFVDFCNFNRLCHESTTKTFNFQLTSNEFI